MFRTKLADASSGWLNIFKVAPEGTERRKIVNYVKKVACIVTNQNAGKER
jgi:hypothetical protein